MKDLQLKQSLLTACQGWAQKRKATIEATITAIEESLTDETKSSAGDKHETGRAMLHIDREQAGEQLKAITNLLEILRKIDIQSKGSYVRLGSVVYTTKASYFVGVSAGPLEIATKTYYAVALDAPIAMAMLGKQQGDIVRFRESEFKITSII